MSGNAYRDTLDDLLRANRSHIASSDCPEELILVLRLKAMRIAHGLTQAEIARRTGGHQANVSRFENVRRTGRSLRSILDYANALGCDICMFLTGEVEDNGATSQTSKEP